MMIDEALLKRYFTGETTAAETELVVDYLAGETVHLPVLNELLEKEQLLPAAEKLDKARTRIVWKQINRHIGDATSFPRSRTLYRRLAYGLTAAALFFAFIWAGIRFIRPVSSLNNTTASASDLGIGWKKIVNDSATTRLARMPDGSRIWLTGYSTLEYAPGYGDSDRLVRLQGEAFFEVAPHPHQPFIVYNDQVSTHVLGTSFNVEAYPKENAIRISLVDGRVAVHTQVDDSLLKRRPAILFLQPGQVLNYFKGDGSTLLTRMKVKDQDSWQQGELVFDEVSLQMALERIAFRHQVVIHIDDAVLPAMKHQKVTATFRNETVREILHNILFIYGYHYTISDRGITIHQ